MTRPPGLHLPMAPLLLALTLTTAARLPGQIPASAQARRVAMAPLAGWVGSWKGAGWSTDAAGKRTEFDLVETVTPKVGGTVLLIEGRGTATGPTPRTTHDGVVLLYYDDRTATYRWNGHELASGPIDALPRLIDGGLEWSFPTGEGGATIRFTIQFDATRWHEVGEVSMDGTSWGRFMEMELTRANP